MIWILTLLGCLIDIWLNKWLEDHWGINHAVNAAYRVVFGGLLLWFFPMRWYLYPLYILGALAGYWQAFNIGLNFIRVPRKPLLYVAYGSGAAFLDKFEHDYQTAVVLIRGILAIICPLTYFHFA